MDNELGSVDGGVGTYNSTRSLICHHVILCSRIQEYVYLPRARESGRIHFHNTVTLETYLERGKEISL